MFGKERAKPAQKSSYGRSRSVRKQGKTAKKSVKIPAIEQVREALEENPKATVSEISLRTGLSKGTVSPLRTQILEQRTAANRSIEQQEDEQKVFDHDAVERSEITQTDPALEQIVVA